MANKLLELTIGEFMELFDNGYIHKNSETKVLTKKEVASLSGYSINTINHKVSKREIPYYKQGGRVFFHKDEIEEWLLSNRRETLDEYVNKQMERRNS